MKYNYKLLISSFFKTLSRSNIFVSFGAISLSLLTSQIFYLESELSVHLFIFFSTLLTYNLQRIISSPLNILNEITEVFKKSKFIFYSMLVGLFGSLYFTSTLNFHSLLIILPLGVLSILYVVAINPIPSLRSLPYVKVFVVSSVWSIATVFLPIANSSRTSMIFDIPHFILAIVYFCFVFGESLPFDIRDIKQDSHSRLRTIPLRLGIKKTIFISMTSLSISIIGIIVLYLLYATSSTAILALGLAILFATFLLSRLKISRPAVYYEIWLESALVLPYPAYLFFTSFL